MDKHIVPLNVLNERITTIHYLMKEMWKEMISLKSKRFWELNEKLKTEMLIYKLEDELNNPNEKSE